MPSGDKDTLTSSYNRADNTYVRKPVIPFKIERKPKQYFFLTKADIKWPEEDKVSKYLNYTADALHGIGMGAMTIVPEIAPAYFGASAINNYRKGNYVQGAIDAGFALPLAQPIVEAAGKASKPYVFSYALNRNVSRINPKVSSRSISTETYGVNDRGYTLYDNFGRPIGRADVGPSYSHIKGRRTVDYIASKNGGHKVTEDTYNTAVQDILDNGGEGLESGWSLMMPNRTKPVTARFPHTEFGNTPTGPIRLLTGTTQRPLPQRVSGNHHILLTDDHSYLFNPITQLFEEVVNNSKLIRYVYPWQQPSRSTLTPAERAGIPKGERNFRLRWHVAAYPGYLLKGLMKGSPLERQLSKNGTISINLLNAYFNKASQIEREVANKVLAERFGGLKIIDYNLFKKAVLDELIGSYNRVPLTEWADYGISSLGYGINPSAPFPGDPLPSLHTFTFESSRIPYGNTKHYGGNPIGHSRTYTLLEEPRTLYVMESLSDWALQALRKKGSIDAQSAYERASLAATKHLQEIEQMKANLKKGLAPDGHKIQYEWERRDIEEIIKLTEKQLTSNKARAARFDAILHPEKYVLENYLKLNYLQRQLQENLRYAAENGLTKMRYPTSETAAKIEGYTPTETIYKDEFGKVYSSPFEHDLNIKLRLDNVVNLLRLENLHNLTMEEYENLLREELKLTSEYSASLKRIPGLIETKGYAPAHQTILRKYADFPKLFLRLFKDLQVRTVTDAKGNTWYEVDVPKGYLSREWLFKKGGRFPKWFKKGGKLWENQ